MIVVNEDPTSRALVAARVRSTKIRMRWAAVATTCVGTLAGFAIGLSLGTNMMAAAISEPLVLAAPDDGIVLPEPTPTPTPTPTETVIAPPITPPIVVETPTPVGIPTPPPVVVNEDPVPPVEPEPTEPAPWQPPTIPGWWEFTTGETLVCGPGAKPAIDYSDDEIGWWAYCEPALVEAGS